MIGAFQSGVLISGGAARTYATLNPALTDTDLTLSGGNLVVTKTGVGSAWRASTATIGKSSGKWYWELKITKFNECIAGVWNPHTANNYIGQTANGYSCYHINFQKIHAGVVASYDPGTNFSLNDIIMFALDMDAGTLAMGHNGSMNPVAFSGLSGVYYPATSIFSGSGSSEHTLNFGATPLVYTPPIGFNAGVYI